MRNSILFIIGGCLWVSLQQTSAQRVSKLEPSAQVEGTYQVTQMTIFTPGQTPKVLKLDQPGNKMSATIMAKRKSQRYVVLTFSQSQNSTPILSFRYGEAYLRTTAKGYDLAINGHKIGQTDGRNLTIDMSALDSEKRLTKRSLIVSKRS